jgi:hypothetical protein
MSQQRVPDGYYIMGDRHFWVIDSQEFDINGARNYLASMGFDKSDTQQYMKSLRLNPIRLDKETQCS